MKPKGEAFVKITRELLESQAWQAQTINCRRFVDFLMLENMHHAGKENGRLVAPQRHLVGSGINNGERVAEAINEAERLGLVTVERGDRRRPNRYALNWLPLHDGAAPRSRWREYRAETRPVMRDNPPSKVGDNPPSKPSVMRDNPPSKPPETLRDDRPSLYRSSYQGGADVSVGEEEDGSVGEEEDGSVGEEEDGSVGEEEEDGRDPVVCPVTRAACDTGEVCRLLRCAREAPSAGICPHRGCGKPAVLAGACAKHAQLPPSAPAGKPNGAAP